MERAARLVNKQKFSRTILAESDLVRGIWPRAVGPAIARHTIRIDVVRNTLVVEVEDAIWQRQLFGLSGQIVERVQQCMGSPEIQQIEFRVGVPKREPQRSLLLRTEAGPARAGDESDSIPDPVLKKVYQLSRKRSTA